MNYTIIAIDYYLQLVEQGRLEPKERTLEFLEVRLQRLMDPKEYDITCDIIRRMGNLQNRDQK